MMALLRHAAWVIVIVLALGAGRAQGEVHFDDSQSDRIRIWNTDFYEIGLRKKDGRVLYIQDKTTGQQVSPGNVYGPWVMRFSNNSWLDGSTYAPGTSARKFTYTWNPNTGDLQLNYAATGTLSCNITVAMHFDDGPEIDSTLMLTNQSALDVELIAYPVHFAFFRDDISGVYVPYIEGMKLLPSFFDTQEFGSGYPGQLFGDFAYTELTTGAFAIYFVRSPVEPLIPSTLMTINDNYGGAVAKYHHDYDVEVGPGAVWTAPIFVTSVGASLEHAMAAYWMRNGHDAMPTLRDKLGANLKDRLAHAVQLKCGFLQGPWTFNGFFNLLPTIPPGSLIHFVTFWPRGFDENYPDYLPPSPILGTQAEFQNLVATARSAGHLVMPYTNPTWWDNESSTMQALGGAVAARARGGTPIYEFYNEHGGYVVCPWDASVINRQEQTRDEFTQTVPCDFMFEDQIGARGPTYDGNDAAPGPMMYNQGLVNVAAASAARLPIMTEGGFDRLSWHESGYCNSHTIGWHWWPEYTYEPYPMTPLWAHENLYFSVHNLAGDIMTNDLPSLTYHVSIGYSLSVNFASVSTDWLRVLDVMQKHLVAPQVGQAMTSFNRISPDITETVFGNGVAVTANTAAAELSVGQQNIAADGFLAQDSDGRPLGGVLTVLNGEPLSGSLPHYLAIEYTDHTISIWQPRGNDGNLSFDRPTGWNDDARVRAYGVTTSGVRIVQPVTVTGGRVSTYYLANDDGHSIDHFTINYCRRGDVDCDGTVALPDYAVLAECLAGPGRTPAPASPWASQDCIEAFDQDLDGDVDLRDFSAFQHDLSARSKLDP